MLHFQGLKMDYKRHTFEKKADVVCIQSLITMSGEDRLARIDFLPSSSLSLVSPTLFSSCWLLSCPARAREEPRNEETTIGGRDQRIEGGSLRSISPSAGFLSSDFLAFARARGRNRGQVRHADRSLLFLKKKEIGDLATVFPVLLSSLLFLLIRRKEEEERITLARSYKI